MCDNEEDFYIGIPDPITDPIPEVADDIVYDKESEPSIPSRHAMHQATTIKKEYYSERELLEYMDKAYKRAVTDTINIINKHYNKNIYKPFLKNIYELIVKLLV